MKVLMTSAEAVPFAKVGGMADVVGSLPIALRKLNVDVRVLMPGYGYIEHLKYGIEPLFTFNFTHEQGTSEIRVYSTVYEGVPFYFLQGWPYFGEEGGVYTEFGWDMPRYTFFSQATLALAWELNQRLGWFPDVIHAHDWHTGLVPFLVEHASSTPPWNQVATMFTIHNMKYQGDYAGWFMYQAGVPIRDNPHLVYQDKTDNIMAMALAYGQVITTVSPRYAVEIQYPHQGYGLDGIIRTRLPDLAGVLNGIDVETWDPAKDPALVANYDVDSVHHQRPANKTLLQDQLNLPQRDDVPVIGLVSRLVWQKGIDLLVPAMRRLLQDFDVQFVALGTGDTHFEHELGQLGWELGWKGARTLIGFDAAVAQHIYAGSDIFLMPSHFEPCGIGQMIAMRYGALPLVRETGGLADTVQNYDNADASHGTGFSFSWEQSDAVYNTLRWAVETFHQRRDAWRRMQDRAMRNDFSWDKSAREYIALYERAIRKKRSG